MNTYFKNFVKQAWSERNYNIYIDRRQWMKYKKLSEKYWISTCRARQIYEKASERINEYQSMCYYNV